MKPAQRSRRRATFALAALAFALSGAGTPACADPVYLPGYSEWRERARKARAAFFAELCGPPAIRRRAHCPPPDEWDAETYERAWGRASKALIDVLWGEPLKPRLGG